MPDCVLKPRTCSGKDMQRPSLFSCLFSFFFLQDPFLSEDAGTKEKEAEQLRRNKQLSRLLCCVVH